jgi:hypothetical protein
MTTFQLFRVVGRLRENETVTDLGTYLSIDEADKAAGLDAGCPVGWAHIGEEDLGTWDEVMGESSACGTEYRIKADRSEDQ